MHKKVINFTKKVVDDVFSTMIFIKPENGEPVIRQDKHNSIPGKKDISGIIGLGGSMSASIMVHFEREGALKAISSMLSSDYREIDADVIDAVGEITNMIAGGIKNELSGIGIELDLGLPIVVNGENFNTNCANKNNSILFPYKIEGHGMFIEVSFKE